MCNDTGRIIVGKNINFIIGILNSKLFFYSVKHFYGGGVLGVAKSEHVQSIRTVKSVS
jgi:hypothetical protein